MGRLPGPGALSAPPDLRPLPLGQAPTFREPWQAKALALVVLLHRQGCFTWDDWVQALAAEIKASPQRPGEDADAAYHRQFLAALEQVVAARALVAPEALAARTAAWRRAYLNTPHGQPVDLAAAGDHAQDDDQDLDHHHHEHHHHEHDHHGHGLAPQRSPVAISPAKRAAWT